jgi:hypothetical protein
MNLNSPVTYPGIKLTRHSRNINGSLVFEHGFILSELPETKYCGRVLGWFEEDGITFFVVQTFNAETLKMDYIEIYYLYKHSEDGCWNLGGYNTSIFYCFTLDGLDHLIERIKAHNNGKM